MDYRTLQRDYIDEILYIILSVVPLIITPFLFDYYYLPKIITIYFLIMIMTIYHITAKKRTIIQTDSLIKILLLYWLTLVFSIFFSINYVKAIWGGFLREEGLIAILAYGILFIFAKTYYRHNKRFVNWVFAGAVLVSLYGIMQYFDFDPIPRDYIRLNWAGRAFSTMGNPNFLGSYLVLMLPLATFTYLTKGKLCMLLASSIIYLCLLYTFTRSALLGFGVILLCLMIYSFKNKAVQKNFAILLVLFVLITVSVNEQSDGRLYGRALSIGKDMQTLIQQDEGYENAGANRIYIWSRTIELVKDSPWVGYGIENLGTVFTEKYSDEMMEMYGKVYIYDKAHNEYLHIAVSTGLPSLMLYLLFIGLCLVKGILLLKTNIMYLPYLTAVMAYLVQAFFNVSVVSVAYIFWIFLGVIVNEHVFTVDGAPISRYL